MTFKNQKSALILCFCAAMLFSSCSQTRNNSQENVLQQSDSTNIANAAERPEYPTVTVEGSSDLGVNFDAAITFNGSSVSIDGNGAVSDNSTLTITNAGSYLLSGDLSNGQIIVDTADEEKVVLYLNGVNINNSSDCAVNIISAPKKVVMYSCDASVNIFSDGSDYYTETEEDVPNAAIYSKEDLEFDGNGEIYVTSNCCKGICSKDDLEILSGQLYVTAIDDGIRGKDSLTISNANINITSNADGLRTSNETDEEKGNMTINNSIVSINAELDGIQSVGTLSIENSEINILCAQGHENAPARNDNDFGDGNFGGGFRGDGNRQPGGRFDGSMPDDFSMPDDMSIPDMPQGGMIPPNMHGDMGKPMANINTQNSAENTTDAQSDDTTLSTKGIKSTGDMQILSGTISIDSADDAIHSNSSCVISGGNISIYAGGDAIHADATLNITGGEIEVFASYEGYEAADIIISGGNSTITASDDGLNATDGTSQGFMSFNASSDVGITINGGNTVINASGDGIDSNGYVTMSDGSLIVYGPTNGGNGALDYQGSFDISGGTLLAVGASQMAMSVSNSANGVLYFNTSMNQDTIMQIADSKENEIFCFAAPKSYSNIVFTSPDIISQESYIISTGGTYSVDSDNGIYSGGSYENAEANQTVNAN